MGKKPTKEAKDERDGTKQLERLTADVAEIVTAAQQTAVRSVNAMMTAAYWSVGRRIVDEEQRGEQRAGYGEMLIPRLARDLEPRFGRGFSYRGLEKMRALYRAYPNILPTPSAESQGSSKTDITGYIETLAQASQAFPLPWSHYVRLLSVHSEAARRFYEEEALRGGWSERQLSRQISTQFFERTIRAKDRDAFLQNGRRPQPDEHMTLAETIKEPYLLEFLNLKDEYSESDAEEALINRMQSFLLELGDDFAFVGRQKRLRIDDEWFRVDLLFFHRRLRCLVIVELKRGKLSYADAGQINMYCNYAREHWMLVGENPPVGLVLCTEKGAALAHYAFDGLGSKVLAAQYKTILPSETELAMELARAEAERKRRQLPAPADPESAEPKPRKPRGGGGGSRAGEAVAPWLAAAMLH